MDALATNANGAGLATDAVNSLADSSLDAVVIPLWSAEEEAIACERVALAKASELKAAWDAIHDSASWEAYKRLATAQNANDSDVPYAERGLRVDTCREPWLLHGLPSKRGWLNYDDAAIYEHRLEVSDALYLAGHPGADGRMLLPGFTLSDWNGFTDWRPWNVALLESEMDPESPYVSQRLSAVAKRSRFNATLAKVAQQHEDRHWFFAHPHCSECFQSDPAPRFASWLLQQGSETRFPADQWDGEVPAMPTAREAVAFMTAAQLADLPQTGWLIPGVLPDSGAGILRARDQSFKSFMALSMALEIVAAGGRVLYCAGEGANNFHPRIEAWFDHHEGPGASLDDGLDLLPAVPNLFSGDDLYDRVYARARHEQYDLIVIDTYARATAGSDLNSQGDQAIVTARVDELRRATGGTILLVAHSQKTDTDTSGSIEIEDARDFVFSMKRSGSEVTFQVTKQKDGVESAKPVRYVAKPVAQSIVLVPAGEAGDQPVMTAKDWIIAALDNTRGLGPLSGSEIREWINDHPDFRRFGNKPLGKSTSSSTLSRLVEAGVVERKGTKYLLAAAEPKGAS